MEERMDGRMERNDNRADKYGGLEREKEMKEINVMQ
jgi:hypothetical protein